MGISIHLQALARHKKVLKAQAGNIVLDHLVALVVEKEREGGSGEVVKALSIVVVVVVNC